MAAIHTSPDGDISDAGRRAQIFDGDLIATGQGGLDRALSQFARETLEQKLGAEPRNAQQRMSEIEFAGLFASGSATLLKGRIGLELVWRPAADSALTALSRCDDLSPLPEELVPAGTRDRTSPNGDAALATSPR
jgi:hypothetical protein